MPKENYRAEFFEEAAGLGAVSCRLLQISAKPRDYEPGGRSPNLFGRADDEFRINHL